jgi:hypothetical protein
VGRASFGDQTLSKFQSIFRTFFGVDYLQQQTRSCLRIWRIPLEVAVFRSEDGGGKQIGSSCW